MKKSRVGFFAILMSFLCVLTTGCSGSSSPEWVDQLACNHSFGEYVVVKEPTCSAKGESEASCELCGKIDKKSIDKLEHTVVELKEISPTCTETGLTAGEQCSICDAVLKKQVKIPATGHSIIKTPATDPTCQNAGVSEKESCEKCFTVIKGGAEIPALQHVNEDKDPFCDNCGAFALSQANMTPAKVGDGNGWYRLKIEDFLDDMPEFEVTANTVRKNGELVDPYTLVFYEVYDSGSRWGYALKYTFKNSASKLHYLDVINQDGYLYFRLANEFEAVGGTLFFSDFTFSGGNLDGIEKVNI